jgi:hypothetical protein
MVLYQQIDITVFGGASFSVRTEKKIYSLDTVLGRELFN